MQGLGNSCQWSAFLTSTKTWVWSSEPTKSIEYGGTCLSFGSWEVEAGAAYFSSKPVRDPVSDKVGGISEDDTQDCPLIYIYTLKKKKKNLDIFDLFFSFLVLLWHLSNYIINNSFIICLPHQTLNVRVYADKTSFPQLFIICHSVWHTSGLTTY